MIEFLSENVSVVLAVLLLAACPMVESKVAIPCALSVALWGTETLSPISTFALAFLGSLLPCVLVLFISRFIKRHTTWVVQERFVENFKTRHSPQIQKINGKNSTLKKCLAIMAFVAVPLPMTGVWTGSLIAGLTDLKLWQGAVSVALGEAISCAVVLLICVMFKNSVLYVFIASLVLIAIFILVNFFINLFSKREQKKEKRC